MSYREDLNNIDHDLGKLHTYISDYLIQIAGASYVGTQAFKGALERLLIPYSGTQIEFIKTNFGNDVREPMVAYWILKLLGQRNPPEYEDGQDEINILNQMLYTPGRVVPGVNADNIVANNFNITAAVSLLTKIYLMRTLVENYTVIRNYIDNNKENVDQNFPELNTLTLAWLKNEFAQIRDIATKPNTAVTSLYGWAPIPAPTKAVPALKMPVPAVAAAVPSSPVVLPASPVRPDPAPIRSPVYAPHHPVPAPYAPVRPVPAPSYPAYAPPRHAAHSGHMPPPPPSGGISNWQAFMYAHHNTPWYARFSLYRVFNNDAFFNVTPNASLIPSLFYNLLFWLQIPLIVDLITDILRTSFEAVKSNTLYLLGRGNFFDFFKHSIHLAFGLTLLILSPLLVAGSIILGLTSLPIIAVNELVKSMHLPWIVENISSLALRMADAVKDLALIAAGLFYFSNFLGSFAIGSQLLTNVGLNALLPFFSGPFGALAVTVGASILLVPPLTMTVLAGVRILENTLGAIFHGVGKILRFSHSADIDEVNVDDAGARLGDLLARRRDRVDATHPAREFRPSRRNAHSRNDDNPHDEVRPSRRIRVR
jgi:hypothetical protein